MATKQTEELKKEVNELKTQVASLETKYADLERTFSEYRAEVDARLSVLKTDILLKR